MSEWKREYDDLARYNAERHGGLMHTPETDRRMAEVQRDYDENYLPHLHSRGPRRRWLRRPAWPLWRGSAGEGA